MDDDAPAPIPDPPQESSECPSCGRDANPTGETSVIDRRRYELMKCSRCFNAFWISAGP